MASSFPVRGDPQTALSSLELLRGAEQVVRTPADPHFLLAVIINPLETTISSASSESAPSPKGTLWSTQLFFFFNSPQCLHECFKMADIMEYNGSGLLHSRVVVVVVADCPRGTLFMMLLVTDLLFNL